MKKFIISFGYHGFLFSAKAVVKRDQGKTIISTTVISNPLICFLEDRELMFIQAGKGFDLLLFKPDRSFEVLTWNIKHEYVDKTQIVPVEVFSLS